MATNFAYFSVDAQIGWWSEVVDNLASFLFVDLIVDQPVLFVAWALVVDVVDAQLSEQVQLFG